MSLRTFFARRRRCKRPPLGAADTPSLTDKHLCLRHRLLRFFIMIAIIASAVWLLMAIWYQFGATSAVTWLASLVIIGLLSAQALLVYWPKKASALVNKVNEVNKSNKVNNAIKRSPHPAPIKRAINITLLGYIGVWLIGLGWFFSIEPKQHRNWQPDVAKVLTYSRDVNNPDLITFTNVRNFDWQEADTATERWESRTVDMSKLTGVDVVNSYWMGPLIAHTLVSFRFEDERPLSFSFEIRKEADESFSALAGFFRRYELSLIAAEERDILYTRTNARGEQVYLFPVSHLQKHEVQALFESYLKAADELEAAPAWYNTLISNCTNIIFYMARIVSGERLPWDYRIWVSGWLPNYLYDMGMLDAAPAGDGNPWSMDMWYERAHLNPKVTAFDNLATDRDDNARKFSAQIRQGIPQPPLAASRAAAESNAQSAAAVSSP